MVNDTIIVRSQVSETGFGFYTDDDLRKLSCCQVTSPVSQDSLGNPLIGGLLDPRLGPTDQGVPCRTCGLNYINCPGHPGHIELDVPCIRCHRFRISSQKVRQNLIKLKLLEMGDLDAALSVEDICSPPLEDKEKTHAFDVEKTLQGFEQRYDIFINSKTVVPSNMYCKTVQRDQIAAFQKLALHVKKCENCGAYSPSYRKDGHAKIFQKPLSKKLQDSMKAMKMKVRTALEELQGEEEEPLMIDDSDESDDEFEIMSNYYASESMKKSTTQTALSAVKKENKEKSTVGDKYMAPLEVQAQVQLLWSKHTDYLDFVWSRAINSGRPRPKADPLGWKLFFNRVVLVPPNRFRPSAKVGESSSEHPQNLHLSKILEANESIRTIYINTKDKGGALDKNLDLDEVMNMMESMDNPEEDVDALLSGKSSTASMLSKLVTHWIALQNAVNCYMDSAKDPNPLANQGPSGVRQLLERKEGLFRMNMMGKRVNYCCRSVISPDPYLGTNEIGIPVAFARTLHYPIPVNDWNVKYLRQLVERGPFEYPGANIIETPQGQLIKLEKLSAAERAAKAKLLLSSPGYKVYRHLIDGDVLLVNRQPTLHKPGIMAHKARVLKHIREQTLRMNYANCNTYNADFDGDEMNCHFVQNEIARAEANFICNTDNQYIVPTSGNPIRGLIQDHVTSAVKLTCKNTFLTRDEFQQLLFIAVSGLTGTEIITARDAIKMPLPTIMKPKPLWTGKQVISSLLAHICKPPMPLLHLDSNTRTPASVFGAEEQENVVIVRYGELLCGVLDKSAIGNASLGIVHAVYELYGPDYAGKLLSAFGRLFTFYLQDAGHTCGIEDLLLNAKAEDVRRNLLKRVLQKSVVDLKGFFDNDEELKIDSDRGLTDKETKLVESQVADLLSNDLKNGKVKLDGAMQGFINKYASEVIKACLPGGLEQPFLKNSFTIMVLTGAKGSSVNQSQITCFLGQQALEGQRVPIMISGKTLPSFRSYDISPRAGGFVQDRFLTGVRPQEFYFHCMAGREGLVDTAVKTSRSGYLQRCLVKHLEELKVNYDMTVRDSGNNIVQFLYGEDGLDPVHSAVLGGKPNQMVFLARNNQALVHKFGIHENYFSNGLEVEPAKAYHDMVARAAQTMQSTSSLQNIAKNAVVMAKRKISVDKSWSVKNLSNDWHMATVIKVRKEEKPMQLDLKYEDGHIEKKVPIELSVQVKPFSSHGEENMSVVMSNNGFIPVEVVRVGLPTTALNKFNVGSVMGCVSEKVQNAVKNYIAKNPDGCITSQTTNSTVSAESLELLVWVKYLRSLACPGEAVGCVAAQSIGEPSTQMTLNTFHLAGHGGANVTLGIPRLREIIMTASTKPKTPLMTIPLWPTLAMSDARLLSRQLARLSIGQILDHRGGVEVGERLQRGIGGFLERVYRIRLCFEHISAIEKAFGIGFESEVVRSIKDMLLPKLAYLIRMEQRKSRDRMSGKIDLYISRGGGDEVASTRKSTSGEDDNDEEDASSPIKKGKRRDVMDSLMEGDNEDEDEDQRNDDSDDEGQRKKGRGKEINGYDDMEEEVDENGDDNDDSNHDGKEDLKGSESDDNEEEEESVGSDDDDNDADENEKAKPSKAKDTKGSSSAVTKQKKPRAKKTSQSLSALLKGSELRVDIKNNFVEFYLSFPSDARKLLMVQIVEKAAQLTTIRSTKHISNAFAINEEKLKVPCVQTEGVNFEAIWELPESVINHNELGSNDIYGILQTYGVEAARRSIMNEITNVFGAYGIDVNPRHLSLVADFMTRNGGYVAMNRIGMMECPSTLLQMSFETTCSFMMKAAMEGKFESQESPSSRLVVGSVTKVGTGCFDVMVPVSGASTGSAATVSAH